MKVYTLSEARRRLVQLLDEAVRGGSVGIRRKDGRIFVLQPTSPNDSPLNVKGVNLGLSREEIVAVVRDGRNRP